MAAAHRQGSPDWRGSPDLQREQGFIDAGNFRYVIDGPWVNDPDTQNSGEVACGQNYRVTGGGVITESETAGEQAGNSSLPADDADFIDPVGTDGDDAPDDGWIAFVDNTSANELEFLTIAICRKRGSG
jgi:hypothetical protein